MTVTTETDADAENVHTDQADAADTENTPENTAAETDDEQSDDGDAETFPRSVVEKLRQENGRYRQRAAQADAYAARLHTALVAATGRLADPADLEYDAAHLDDEDALTAAIDELLADKPHLASRKPSGDIGQGQRGGSSQPFSLLDTLKSMT